MESLNNDRVLAEVIAAEEDGDAFEDASPLPSADGTDDSDFYDAPHEKGVDDVLEAEEGSSDENAANGISAEENEGSDEDEEIGESIFGAAPKIHQTHSKNRKVFVCVRFGSLKKTYESREAFHAAFEVFQSETYKQFLKRLSTSVKIRNNHMTKNAEALKLTGKRARKAVNLIPTDWERYGITFKCIHGQEYNSRGKGKRKHRKARDTKCSAKLSARVTATSYGDLELKRIGSGVRNHYLTKELWESYAENRTVKDVRLTNDVEVLQSAGANGKGILLYIHGRTAKFKCFWCDFGF
ncbi:hypothetical protein GN958_ATG21631 [Phytophthora infestans]|uniref:Uncharacterized protein n=1 Tax=Phytophthora infestans TaxID=4787 RepID=A0A8S9TJM5_PHYIN|nr:hypothetical protein GN958_ATG21631 [Phytophthora infestans]